LLAGVESPWTGTATSCAPMRSATLRRAPPGGVCANSARVERMAGLRVVAAVVLRLGRGGRRGQEQEEQREAREKASSHGRLRAYCSVEPTGGQGRGKVTRKTCLESAEHEAVLVRAPRPRPSRSCGRASPASPRHDMYSPDIVAAGSLTSLHRPHSWLGCPGQLTHSIVTDRTIVRWFSARYRLIGAPVSTYHPIRAMAIQMPFLWLGGLKVASDLHLQRCVVVFR